MHRVRNWTTSQSITIIFTLQGAVKTLQKYVFWYSLCSTYRNTLSHTHLHTIVRNPSMQWGYIENDFSSFVSFINSVEKAKVYSSLFLIQAYTHAQSSPVHWGTCFTWFASAGLLDKCDITAARRRSLACNQTSLMISKIWNTSVFVTSAPLKPSLSSHSFLLPNFLLQSQTPTPPFF